MSANHLGRVVRYLRGSSTQLEAAGRAGIAVGNWRAVERGKHYPSHTKGKIAEALGCALEDLEELERRVQGGSLVLGGALGPEGSPESLMLLVEVVELQKISDPERARLWRLFSRGMWHLRLALHTWLLIQAGTGEAKV